MGKVVVDKNLRARAAGFKIAPATLYNPDLGYEWPRSKTFCTQEEVDKACGEGWYGPPWYKGNEEAPFLSTIEFHTKADLLTALGEDSRYDDIQLTKKMTFLEIEEAVAIFEDNL